MSAFHGDPAIKAVYVARVKSHASADEIVQGTYWERGRGCAVGCTIHSSEHERYEQEIGIPRHIAYLQDRIFEGLPQEEAKSFPLAFLEAIPVGADLAGVIPSFMVWLLVDGEHGVLQYARGEQNKAAIEQVAALYQRQIEGGSVSDREWRAAADYAAGASEAAAYASADAADAASAYAADAAAYAEAYADAADAASAYAADAAAYAASAASAAKMSHFRAMRDQLLMLLMSAEVTV